MHRETALHFEAAGGYNEVISVLLKYKHLINTNWENGWTPLHNAAKAGKWDTCTLLLKTRADLNITEADIRSALALIPQHVKTAALLIRAQNSALE